MIYQAGADPHIDDPLGGILTTKQMSWRDRQVFEQLGHKPLVWNLAGGYQIVPSWLMHRSRPFSATPANFIGFLSAISKDEGYTICVLLEFCATKGGAK